MIHLHFHETEVTAGDEEQLFPVGHKCALHSHGVLFCDPTQPTDI